MTSSRSEEYTDEQRAIIVRARARLAYIDTLTEPQRTLAMLMVPESEWPDRIRKTEAAVAAILGQTRRVWHPNPDYMKPGEPVGYWSTEKAPVRGASSGISRGNLTHG
jgi:hypothetical protein